MVSVKVEEAVSVAVVVETVSEVVTAMVVDVVSEEVLAVLVDKVSERVLLFVADLEVVIIPGCDVSGNATPSDWEEDVLVAVVASLALCVLPIAAVVGLVNGGDMDPRHDVTSGRELTLVDNKIVVLVNFFVISAVNSVQFTVAVVCIGTFVRVFVAALDCVVVKESSMSMKPAPIALELPVTVVWTAVKRVIPTGKGSVVKCHLPAFGP